MSNLNFYERQLEFQNKLNKIHDEQQKLENEFEKLNVEAKYSGRDKMDERVIQLKEYHQKVCERQRIAKERNFRMLKEFDEMKRMMATMQLQTNRLKQAKIKCMREVERLYPEWKQKLQLNRAQQQLHKTSVLKQTTNQLGMTYPPQSGAVATHSAQGAGPSINKRPVHVSMSNLSTTPPTHQSEVPKTFQQFKDPPKIASSSNLIIGGDRFSSSSFLDDTSSENEVEAQPERDTAMIQSKVKVMTSQKEKSPIISPAKELINQSSEKLIKLQSEESIKQQNKYLITPSTEILPNQNADVMTAPSPEETTNQNIKTTTTPPPEITEVGNSGGGDHDEVKKVVEKSDNDEKDSDDDLDLPSDSFFNTSNEDEEDMKNNLEEIQQLHGDDQHITEPFTSVHDSLETFNTPIVIPGVKESTLESTLSDTATSITSPIHQPLAASSAYQALRDTMDGSTINHQDDNDQDDAAENILSPNSTGQMKIKSVGAIDDMSSDEDDDQDVSSILSSDDDLLRKSDLQSGYQPTVLSQQKQQQPEKQQSEKQTKKQPEKQTKNQPEKQASKPKRYRAPWESDSDDLDINDERPPTKTKMDDDDFDFYD